MTRFCLPFLAAALLGAPLAAAHADTRTVEGRGLILDARKLSSTTNIEVDSSLGNSIRVTADESCLTVIGSGGGNVVVNADQCAGDVASVSIAIPAGAAVTIAGNGNGDIHVSGSIVMLTGDMTGDGDLSVSQITGPLALNIHANCNATIDELDGPATLNMASSGDVHVRNLRGPLHVNQTGAGDLTVTDLQAPVADMALKGSGDARIGNGNIAMLHAASTGSGDLTVAATVGAADLTTTGSGGMKLSKVSGTVHRTATGDGEITIGGEASSGTGSVIPPIPPIPPIPDMDFSTSNHGRGDSGFGHVVAAIIVGGILFYVWRTIQRAGGLPMLRARFGTPLPAAAPTHPGIIALRDTMTRLDARLARVETYVTTREFDLQRKFRELDTH